MINTVFQEQKFHVFFPGKSFSFIRTFYFSLGRVFVFCRTPHPYTGKSLIACRAPQIFPGGKMSCRTPCSFLDGTLRTHTWILLVWWFKKEYLPTAIIWLPVYFVFYRPSCKLLPPFITQDH